MDTGQPQAQNFATLPFEEQLRRVNEVLTSEVYPFLAMHGGGAEILDIQGSEITLRYFGACNGCMLAGDGTLQFIEQTLQQQVDGNIRLIPA